MRARIQIAACLVVALTAVALALSACGGGGGGDSTDSTAGAGTPAAGQGGGTTPPSPATSAAAAKKRAAQEAAESPAQRKKRAARERKAYELKRYGPPSKQSAGFVHSARTGVLRHLPEYGEEASAGERAQAQALLSAYLGAVDAKDWGEACGYLLPYYVAQLAESARAATGAPRDCAETLSSALAGIMEQPGPRFPDSRSPQVASFRVEPYPADRAAELELDVERSGIALLHGSDGHDYYATMTREGGEWKLTMLLPQPLR